MSSIAATPALHAAPAAAAPVDPTKVSPITGKKICCACPETKRPRDECVVKYTEANCLDFIEAHKQCLRSQGFKI